MAQKVKKTKSEVLETSPVETVYSGEGRTVLDPDPVIEPQEQPVVEKKPAKKIVVPEEMESLARYLKTSSDNLHKTTYKHVYEYEDHLYYILKDKHFYEHTGKSWAYCEPGVRWNIYQDVDLSKI